MELVRRHQPDPAKNRLYTKALVLTLLGNLLLAGGKGVMAYLSGSAALYADAANSVSDVVYSIAMVVGLWLSIQPPDLSHPQGHSRFEPVVGLVVTLSMGIAGYEAARTALQRFLAGGVAVDIGLPIFVLLASAAIKTGMFFYIRRLAHEADSPTLNTAAKDNLSDVLTSIAAFLGAFASSHISPLFDPAAGFLVAGWIFKAAFEAGRENLAYLTGAGAPEETRKEIIQAALSVPGVLRVHHAMTEYAGPKLVVDLHINVNGSKTLHDTHAINDAVVEKIESLPNVDRAYVHIEPDNWVD